MADPVVGIMIRTRIGLNVYGTNTELEQLKLGPCLPGATLELAFAFWCELCPRNTPDRGLHDPDGVWHDWLEDAVAFSVTDTRYTAGVSNLRAQVSLLAELAGITVEQCLLALVGQAVACPARLPYSFSTRRYNAHAVAITPIVPSASLPSNTHTFVTSAVGTTEHKIASSVIAHPEIELHRFPPSTRCRRCKGTAESP